jgi:c-di-GMP-binding flagellar brake protein YcgR
MRSGVGGELSTPSAFGSQGWYLCLRVLDDEVSLTTSERRRRERRKTLAVAPKERRRLERRSGDRRHAARAPLDLWVEEDHGDELYFRRTGNLSRGGVYFEQTIPHSLGTKVRLRFTLPGDSEVIEAIGEIVNMPNVKDGLGMGLSFLEISPAHQLRLDAFVERCKLMEA